jgi:predicted alpha/beta-fold hydrolase
VPALLIHAKDDTYIPYEIYQRPEVRANPMVTVVETASGGHLGFLGRRPRRFWSDHAIMEWIATHQVKELTAGSSRS